MTDLSVSDLSFPDAAPPSTLTPVVPSLGDGAAQLTEALVMVHAEDRFGDVCLGDALESLALSLWGEALALVGMPRWSALPSPRHRWVVLERAAWRLSQRIAEAGVQRHPLPDSSVAHLDRVRALLSEPRPSGHQVSPNRGRPA